MPEHPISGFLMFFLFLGGLLCIYGALVTGMTERSLRLVALAIGLPLTAILALEGVLTGWPVATIFSAIAAFSIGRRPPSDGRDNNSN